MEKDYKIYTSGMGNIKITVDSSEVFDKLIIDYYFFGETYVYKRIELEVKYQDFGNTTGADFSVVKLYEKQFKGSDDFVIKPYKNMGMLLEIGGQKIFVPVYDYIADYYDNDLDLLVTYTRYREDGSISKHEVDEFNITDLAEN